MGKPISVDLRARVCEAVREGLSCRQAAAQFKISASSAIRWVSQLNTVGTFVLGPQGGDRKSGRIEAEAAFILGRVAETPDITLTELQAPLSARGLNVGIGTLSRFFNRRQISLKFRRQMVDLVYAGRDPADLAREFEPSAESIRA